MNITMFGKSASTRQQNWRSPLLNPSADSFDLGDYGGGSYTQSQAASYQRMQPSGMGELIFLKQDNDMIKQAVASLERDRDNLRTAIRKLKVENSRFKQKMKRMAEALKKAGIGGDVDMEGELLDDKDFDEIGEFILVGGPKDPFSLRYEVPIKDSFGLEHKSAERYLWYKMALTFDDKEAAEKIRTAETGAKAEEEMQKIKNFNEAQWNEVKVHYWEEGQRLKFEQIRWIQSLLVHTDKLYIAVASQDKVWGTGWRKQRMEAERPKMWDGENQGGKILMKLRDGYKTNHSWMGPYEEQETEKTYNNLRKDTWRRIVKRSGNPRNPEPIARIGLVGRTGAGPIPMGLGNRAGWKKRRFRQI